MRSASLQRGPWCLVLTTLGAITAMAAPPARDYPYRPVPFTAVHFSDAFWLPRLETNRTVTIPYAFRQCEQTHRIENFKVAGGLSTETWQGGFGFNDSDVYKVIEGAAYALMVHPDPKLDAYLDTLIATIAAAQEDDGYLYTAWTARARDHVERIACCYQQEPWDNLGSSHELYNLGHLYEAAAAHFQATGKRSLLIVATRSADLVCRVFGPGRNEGVPGHEEIEIGLVKLYRATGEARYLMQAKWFLDRRGRDPEDRGAYAQKHAPVTEQTEAVGHAVRANYLYTAMADVAALTGDRAITQAIDALWRDVADRKLYVTGGVGARGSGEAYGEAYELPNRTAYCETCAAIANVYWNHRMFLLHGDSRYIDVMERSLYNNVLAGVSLDGRSFFYPNVLESVHGHARSPWFGCACCPSNLCRFLASVPGYVYAVRDNALYVNLFVDSRAEIDVAGGRVTCRQETRFPWEGRVRLSLGMPTPRPLSLKIRIPDWAQADLSASALYHARNQDIPAPRLAVNGRAVALDTAQGYVTLTRTWSPDDVVTIDWPLPVRRLACDERVLPNRGKVALQRGPLVYCVEHPEVPGGHVLNLLLNTESPLRTRHVPELLGGITRIEGSAWELQRRADGRNARRVRSIAAIPYYAWAHREPGPMAVWLPVREDAAHPLPAPTIASQSRATTSFLPKVGDNRTDFVQDQALPRSSGDPGPGYLHWWPHKGTTEWLQYDFPAPTTLHRVAVYWFDDTGRGECRVPASWRLLYRDGDTWAPVAAAGPYSVTRDALDRVSFAPVRTGALRLEVQLQTGWSAGVQEWIVE